MSAIRDELKAIGRYYRATGMPIVDVSHMATEEAAERVLSVWRDAVGLSRSINGDNNDADVPPAPAVKQAPPSQLLYWEKIPMFDHVGVGVEGGSNGGGNQFVGGGGSTTSRQSSTSSSSTTILAPPPPSPPPPPPPPIVVISECSGESTAHSVRAALGHFPDAAAVAPVHVYRFVNTRRRVVAAIDDVVAAAEVERAAAAAAVAAVSASQAQTTTTTTPTSRTTLTLGLEEDDADGGSTDVDDDCGVEKKKKKKKKGSDASPLLVLASSRPELCGAAEATARKHNLVLCDFWAPLLAPVWSCAGIEVPDATATATANMSRTTSCTSSPAPQAGAGHRRGGGGVAAASPPPPRGLVPLSADFFRVMEAIETTVRADDGRVLESVPTADIVLVGVSRSSKTPAGASNFTTQHTHARLFTFMIVTKQ